VAISLIGEWRKATRRLAQLEQLSRRNADKAVRRNASNLRDNMKEAIVDGKNLAPNAPLTMQVKGSSKPLVDHGDLLNSIDYMQIAPAVYWTGIPAFKKTKDGIGIADIATVHVFGATIKPKRGRALALPATREAARLARKYGSVRAIPGLFRPHGTKVLARKSNNEFGFDIMFILMEQVIIPPRDFMMPTYNALVPTMINRNREAAAATLRGQVYIGT
jgi:hypothetical protein